MMPSLFWMLAFFIMPWATINGQNIISVMDHNERHVYDRMIILTGGGPQEMHSSIYPYYRHDLVALAVLFSKTAYSPTDEYDVQATLDSNNEFLSEDGGTEVVYADTNKTFYYIRDTSSIVRRKSRHPLWNTFYRTPAFFYEVDVPDFYLRVNPLLRMEAGRETVESVTTFRNQRGITLRGGVGQNVYFHTDLYDSQVRFPNYVNRYTAETGVVPGAGLYKNYESTFFKFSEGRDFLLSNAYVGVNLGKYVGFQLGHHQHFIGDGIRSLLLSDFSTPFFSLKVNTRIWKLHYQNIFAELAADDFTSVSGTNRPIPKKYMAAHYLSFRPGRRLTFGLFETVIFNREGHRFELQYLNPVILYRTVEGAVGSPDNVMIGLNARWDVRKTVSLYGQIIIDDLLVREILGSSEGWWGNKTGHQVGVKYINAAGIENLDLQAEWNRVRPYTYSHYDQNANYSHYNQALAHPLGSNFNEWILSGRFQVTPKIGLQSSLYLITKGEDNVDSVSFGGNILSPNVLRPGDFGHTTGQGIHTEIFLWHSVATYEISPGLFFDIRYLTRTKTSEEQLRELKTNLFQAGIRLNMAAREDLF